MAGKFELKKTPTGKYHFSLKNSNGQIILSSEIYETKKGAEMAIEAVKRNSQNPNLFEKRTSVSGHPYFILKAGNGLELGRSEVFSTRDYMEKIIESVKTNSLESEVIIPSY